MKIINITLLFFILSVPSLYSQVTVNRLDLKGNIREIEIDSILEIPISEFDSIIFKTLTIPDIPEEKSNCAGCSGGYYKSYLFSDNRIIKSDFIRSSNCSYTDSCDNEVSFIYDKVFEKALKYLDFEKDIVYLIWIRLDFDWGVKEKIYIDSNSTFRKFMIVRKSYRYR